MAGRKRDEVSSDQKHPDDPHAWVLLGTDNVHGVDRDIWMCMQPSRCGRDTDPKDRIKHMDKAMRAMAAAIIGRPLDIPGDPIT